MFVVKKRTPNRNSVLQCTLCGEELWHSHARKHVEKRHPGQMGQYEAAARNKAAIISTDGASGDAAGPSSPATTSSVRMKDTSTLDALDRSIARYLVTARIPLDTVESLAFRDLLQSAITVGRTLGNLTYGIPNRSQLIEKSIEGKDGLLADRVAASLDRLKASGPSRGAYLLLDASRDANGVPIELISIRSGTGLTKTGALVWLGSLQTEGLQRTVDALLQGDASRLLLDSMSRETTTTTGGGGGGKRKKATSSSPHLSRIYDWIAPNVFAVGGGVDGSPGALQAMRSLEESRNLVCFGSATRAVSRCFWRVTALPALRSGVVDKLALISNLFSAHQEMRDMLSSRTMMAFDAEHVPDQLVAIPRTLEQALALKSTLLDVVDSGRFQEFKASWGAGISEQCSRMEAYLLDDDFWTAARFLATLSAGFIAVARVLESSDSVCGVYKLWSLLCSTVSRVFAHPERPLAFANETLFGAVKRVIVEEWARSHFPVYSAGFFLCPRYHGELVRLKQTSPDVFARLLSDTAHCLGLFHSRFDHQGTLRVGVFKQNVIADELAAARAAFTAELQDYASCTGRFNPQMFTPGALGQLSPSEWWTAMHGQTILSVPAARFCALSPSTRVLEDFAEEFMSGFHARMESNMSSLAMGLNFLRFEEKETLRLKSKANVEEEGALEAELAAKTHFELTATGIDMAFLAQKREEYARRAAARALIEEEERLATADSIAREVAVGNVVESKDEENALLGFNPWASQDVLYVLQGSAIEAAHKPLIQSTVFTL